MPAVHVVAALDEEHVHRQLATLLLAAVLEKPDLALSVFAGTPAYGLYHLLVERAHAEGIDFSRVRFVVFDELVRADAPFRTVMQERLFGPLAIPGDNVIAFDPRADRASELARIRGWLAIAGVDIALLSADSRGHIGFHVAGAALDSGAAVVPVTNRARWEADEAFTLGLADLARAERVLLFACGKNLADVVQELTEGAFEPGRPISVLQRHSRVTLVADRGALARVDRTERLTGHHAGLYILDAAAPPEGRTILVVSPHPDDAAISVGGTLALLAPRNRIVTAVMTTGHRSFIPGTQRDERIAIREREALQESRLLGVDPRFLRLPFYDANYEVTERDLGLFGGLFDEVSPDWLFLPHRADHHPAHAASRKVALETARRACREQQRCAELWSYEGPWALFNRGEFDAIVPLPRACFEKKAAAIRAHRSQVERTPFDVAAESLARLRSALVPESELSGYGAQPPRLEPFVELFRQEGARGAPALPGDGD